MLTSPYLIVLIKIYNIGIVIALIKEK